MYFICCILGRLDPLCLEDFLVIAQEGQTDYVNMLLNVRVHFASFWCIASGF